MPINLTEDVKTYLTYAGTAITGAAVGIIILLTGQGINNWRHPKVLASAITGDMLQATHGANVEELTQRRTQLEGATAGLTQAQTDAQRQLADAQRTFDAAQAAVEAAGDTATDAQREAVTAAQTALTAAQTALTAAQAALTANTEAIAGLTAQINNEGAVATLIGNNDQRAILVNRLNQIPVPPAPAPAGATH